MRFLFIALSCAALLSGCRKPESPLQSAAPTPEPTVITATVEPMPPEVVEFRAKAMALREAELAKLKATPVPAAVTPAPATPTPATPRPVTPVPSLPVPSPPVIVVTATPVPAPAPAVQRAQAALAPAKRKPSPYPIQVQRWQAAVVNPVWRIALDKKIAIWERNAPTYRDLQLMVKNGVPAEFIFGMHTRESDNSFRHHPHEGSPLTGKTKFVPKNRPPGNPPFTFLESGKDAYYDYEHLDRWDWQDLGTALEATESFNGMGYKKRGVPTPYLWSATSQYVKGKYVADGKWNPDFVDKQPGVCALLLRMRERGIPIPFDR